MSGYSDILNKINIEFLQLKHGIDKLFLPLINKPLVDKMLNSTIDDDKDFTTFSENSTAILSKMEKLMFKNKSPSTFNRNLKSMKNAFVLVSQVLGSLSLNITPIEECNVSLTDNMINSLFEGTLDSLNNLKMKLSDSSLNNTNLTSVNMVKKEFNKIVNFGVGNNNFLHDFEFNSAGKYTPSNFFNQQNNEVNLKSCSENLLAKKRVKNIHFINKERLDKKKMNNNPEKIQNLKLALQIEDKLLSLEPRRFNLSRLVAPNKVSKIKNKVVKFKTIKPQEKKCPVTITNNYTNQVTNVKVNNEDGTSEVANSSQANNEVNNNIPQINNIVKSEINNNNVNNDSYISFDLQDLSSRSNNKTPNNNFENNLVKSKPSKGILFNSVVCHNPSPNNNLNTNSALYKLNFRSDCIRKRIKTFFNNYILNKLNELVKHYDSTIFFLKLPKELIVNIKIHLNNNLLTKTVKDLFSTKVEDAKENKRIEHNIKMMNQIEDPTFKAYALKTCKEVYLEYIESPEYKLDVALLAKRENSEYLNIYQQHVDGFLSYFKVLN